MRRHNTTAQATQAYSFSGKTRLPYKQIVNAHDSTGDFWATANLLARAEQNTNSKNNFTNKGVWNRGSWLCLKYRVTSLINLTIQLTSDTTPKTISLHAQAYKLMQPAFSLHSVHFTTQRVFWSRGFPKYADNSTEKLRYASGQIF